MLAMAGQPINIPVPSLSADDYPDVCGVCAGLPPTYAEWQFNQRQYHRHQRRSGFKLISMPIDLAQLMAYCARERCSFTTDALYCLAQEKLGSKPVQRRKR